jgi:hypothetical protein
VSLPPSDAECGQRKSHRSQSSRVINIIRESALAAVYAQLTIAASIGRRALSGLVPSAEIQNTLEISPLWNQPLRKTARCISRNTKPQNGAPHFFGDLPLPPESNVQMFGINRRRATYSFLNDLITIMAANLLPHRICMKSNSAK